jgi:hypothetical protein
VAGKREESQRTFTTDIDHSVFMGFEHEAIFERTPHHSLREIWYPNDCEIPCKKGHHKLADYMLTETRKLQSSHRSHRLYWTLYITIYSTRVLIFASSLLRSLWPNRLGCCRWPPPVESKQDQVNLWLCAPRFFSILY